MKVRQYIYTEGSWMKEHPELCDICPSLILIFGSIYHIDHKKVIESINDTFQDAVVIGCTTAGEIGDNQILDNSITLTLIEFENSSVVSTSVFAEKNQTSFDIGQEAARRLPKENLKHLIVLSEGLSMNGSELVDGILSEINSEIKLTGALAGDGEHFLKTCLLNKNEINENGIVLLGFYGEQLKIGFGCYGGWDPFGPDRLITKSEEKELFELDNEPALKLYKNYLGSYASKLPSSGLFFPLSIRDGLDETERQVRTIVGIDEEKQSLTFVGHIPIGSYARLMKSNNHQLIEGASNAAKNSIIDNASPSLAIVFSCVGRKLILKQRVEEEIEALIDVYGANTTLSGFYSYGEIAPHNNTTRAALHNQTICITTISE
jgi:hypothetical protein